MAKYYKSPRWSYEVADCAMPMTLDTYSNCSFGCIYCFSQQQRGYLDGYYSKQNIKNVSVNRIKGNGLKSYKSLVENDIFTKLRRDTIYTSEVANLLKQCFGFGRYGLYLFLETFIFMFNKRLINDLSFDWQNGRTCTSGMFCLFGYLDIAKTFDDKAFKLQNNTKALFNQTMTELENITKDNIAYLETSLCFYFKYKKKHAIHWILQSKNEQRKGFSYTKRSFMKLIYLCGIGGAGKTYVTKKLLGNDMQVLRLDWITLTIGNNILGFGDYTRNSNFAGGDKELSVKKAILLFDYKQNSSVMWKYRNYDVIIENHILSKSVSKRIIQSALDNFYMVNLVYIENKKALKSRIKRQGNTTLQCATKKCLKSIYSAKKEFGNKIYYSILKNEPKY